MFLDYILSNNGYILDQQRQKFPRFFFYTNQHDDTEPIMDIFITNGKMLQFRSDFPFTGFHVVDLLSRVQNKMKQVVCYSILAALYAREFTEASKWIVRYLTQSLIIAESIYFSRQLKSLL